MDLEEIKRLVEEFHRVDYKNLFGALIIYEKKDYLNIEDLNKGDIEYLEELYDEFIERDYITGLLDTAQLFEDEEEY